MDPSIEHEKGFVPDMADHRESLFLDGLPPDPDAHLSAAERAEIVSGKKARASPAPGNQDDK